MSERVTHFLIFKGKLFSCLAGEKGISFEARPCSRRSRRPNVVAADIKFTVVSLMAEISTERSIDAPVTQNWGVVIPGTSILAANEEIESLGELPESLDRLHERTYLNSHASELQ